LLALLWVVELTMIVDRTKLVTSSVKSVALFVRTILAPPMPLVGPSTINPNVLVIGDTEETALLLVSYPSRQL
jgi:hypothetical protein